MNTPTLPDLQEHAERMFEACAELRLLDAPRGRDSDMLDARVTALVKTHYGAPHA